MGALLLLALIWTGPAKATGPLCTINGGSTYTDCVLPAIIWTAAANPLGGNYYPGPNDSAEAFYNYMQTSNPHLCDHGCSTSLQDQPTASLTHLIQKVAVLTVTTSSGGTSNYSGTTSQKASCPPGYNNPMGDRDPTGQWTVYACRPEATFADTVTRADAPDTGNPEGCPDGCNPVALSDLHKKDHVVDYQNASPYPIVWSRNWNGRVNQWFFNYDRRLMASLLASDPSQANVTLRRQDGQTLAFHGTLSGGTWTWTPNLGSVNKNAMALITLQSNASLTSFTVLNHHDETETYNALGQLTAVQDIRALPLTFTYDPLGRLTLITDASARTLAVTYPDNDASTGTSITVTDKDGNVVPYTFHSYVGPGAAQANLFPEIVSNGTLAVGYVVVPNPAGGYEPPAVLSEVILPDSTVLTYNYDTSGNYLGLTDENGDRYSTYTYAGSKLSKTVHGVGQETIQYSSTKVTFPNSQFTTYGKDSASLKNTSMSQRCAWCTGDMAKTTSYDAAANPTSITDFDNHTQTRVYDQARGVPTSITDASGTAQARTTTITWDPRFLKPTVIVTPAQTPSGAGTSTTTNTYNSNGDVTAWSVVVTGPSSYSLTRSGSATYNAFSEPLTVTDARGKVTTFTYDTQGNRLTWVDALGHTTTYSGYDTAGNVGDVTDPNGLHTTFTYDGRQRIAQTQRGCAGTGCHWEITTVTYNPMGAVAKVVGPNGRGIAYHYDTAHRRTSEDVLDTTGAIMGTLTYTLSVSSEVTAKTYKDAAGTTIQTQGLGYDALSRLTAVIDSHTKTFGQTWDAQDNLATTTDPL